MGGEFVCKAVEFALEIVVPFLVDGVFVFRLVGFVFEGVLVGGFWDVDLFFEGVDFA
jgi:hypothetical protein